MNLLTLPLVNPRHHIGKLIGFAYLLFEAFMRAYVDAYMKLLYPSCLARLIRILQLACVFKVAVSLLKVFVGRRTSANVNRDCKSMMDR